MSECSCGTQKELLESQVKALKDLIEVAKAVVSTLDLDTVLQAILNSAMGFAETPAGSVALYYDAKRELSLHAHSGLTADFVKKERWEVAPGGLTEQVLSAGEIFLIEDTEKTPFFKNPIALNEGIRSLVCVPLIFQSRIVGILYLDDFKPREFDREKMNMLSILASFAAMAIHNATLHKRTKLLAITDSLTGLHNHRYFKQYFRQEMGRAKRYHKPFSIIMMDVDDFKSYNDSYGHATGDRLLALMGEIILETIRGVDVAFRYGGEEFIVLLPETTLDKAILAAERLRESVQAGTASRPVDGSGRGVTVSIGVASYPDNADKMDELFNIVDSLLYLAKRCGKNKVYHQESLQIPAP
ncbi:sensor diguanylate cyclase, GAF domain-containing [Citrifermentans bemidjiense Bem]|uniref:diguanylate cyclase n=1 Tax=Citrifermentans bemidjiense (strain ATCC BAA-1014 / DSM 16622 / JCM 12645 / Bem) TaxID=404380 RepID=B5EHL1_CITBB|nr:sensor domain-containing diguanylate cyclase [Citrifermentans bemidjiense]ACH38221.1 sensor diguanylate cyclase, GAF domain-containing [Citrifermentans bemidjiense Bem]